MLIVDDSAFIRRVVRDIVDASDEFIVAGEAEDGESALRQVHALHPDLVTLDIAMPGLNGLDTLGYLMSEVPRPVVMLSALGDGDVTTIRALELGAVDVVRKPSRDDTIDLPTLAERLMGALRAARDARLGGVPMLVRRAPIGRIRARYPNAATHIVAIAASTGGPRALAEIIPELPAGLPAAVIIVQHMAAGFTAGLASRLHSLSHLPVCEASDGAPLLAGEVYVAPGGKHTTVELGPRGPVLRVRAGAAVHGVSPAADPMMVSVADVFGAACVAVVLTGMGQDGAVGFSHVRSAGGYGVVQDEATSIVFGMPQAALASAGADRVVPLNRISAAILEGLALRGCDQLRA